MFDALIDDMIDHYNPAFIATRHHPPDHLEPIAAGQSQWRGATWPQTILLVAAVSSNQQRGYCFYPVAAALHAPDFFPYKESNQWAYSRLRLVRAFPGSANTIPFALCRPPRIHQFKLNSHQTFQPAVIEKQIKVIITLVNRDALLSRHEGKVTSHFDNEMLQLPTCLRDAICGDHSGS